MKKIFLFALACITAAFVITSCKKKDPVDEPATTASNPLIGTWTWKTTPQDGSWNEYTIVFNANYEFALEDLYYQYNDFWDGQQRKGTYVLNQAESICTMNIKSKRIWGRGPDQTEQVSEEETYKYSFSGDTLKVTQVPQGYEKQFVKK